MRGPSRKTEAGSGGMRCSCGMRKLATNLCMTKDKRTRWKNRQLWDILSYLRGRPFNHQAFPTWRDGATYLRKAIDCISFSYMI